MSRTDEIAAYLSGSETLFLVVTTIIIAGGLAMLMRMSRSPAKTPGEVYEKFQPW
jgi:hypothetical protein